MSWAPRREFVKIRGGGKLVALLALQYSEQIDSMLLTVVLQSHLMRALFAPDGFPRAASSLQSNWCVLWSPARTCYLQQHFRPRVLPRGKRWFFAASGSYKLTYHSRREVKGRHESNGEEGQHQNEFICDLTDTHYSNQISAVIGAHVATVPPVVRISELSPVGKLCPKC